MRILTATALFLLTAFFFMATAENKAAAPEYGYQLSLDNNTGVTQTYGTGQVTQTTPDTLNKDQALGSGDALRQREGHRNTHGQHGAIIDRGQSPHTH
ncbi:MAG: hypothetical protein V1913_09925 [Fibrobacterota bacterium]